MKRRWLMTTGIIFCCAAAFLTTKFIGHRVKAYSQGASFVITLVEKRYDLAGNEIYSENILRAYSGTGFVDVIQRKDPNGQSVHLRTIVSFSAATRTVLDPLTDSKTTYALTPGDVRAYLSMESECGQDSSAVSENILGFKAVRKLRRFPDTSHPNSWEVWQSPELRCYPLRFRALDDVSGKVLATREVAFVLLGEPPASLFEEIPSSYIERAPAEVFAEFERRFPGQRGSSSETSQLLDNVYRKRQ
jgi:hypothetical protein